MKVVMVMLFFGVSCFAYSQTKIIAHKSHSGAKKYFSTLYKQNNTRSGNFGLPGDMPITVLDTIHAINDSITILKYRRSKVCVPYGTNYKKMHKKDFEHMSDTLVNNELVKRSNTPAMIKNDSNSRSQMRLYFENPIHEVVFIGFKEEED